LNVKLPPECPPVLKESFLESANVVAKFIRDECEHYSALGFLADISFSL
jgi:hypothetical protein